MTINIKPNNLLAIVLLYIFTCSAIAGASKVARENNDLAPEATAAEAAVSSWDIPYLKEAFIDSTPADRKDGLVVGDLVTNAGNKDMIVKFAEEIAESKHGLYDSMLISHKGKLLFESYYRRGRVNLPHFQGSATKSYVSLLVGRAIQLGYLTMSDLDKPLAFFLKGLDPTQFVRGIEKVTLHQAMTMRSGLRFSEDEFNAFRTNTSQYKGLDQVQAFFELSAPITTESQRYLYQSPDAIMVMQVLDAVVPGSAKDFIKNEFMDKLGINVYGWKSDLSGLPKADESSSLASRDMLKIGTLVINKGQWDGEQLISSKYLADATSGITNAAEDWQPDDFKYGYFWYQTDIAIGDKAYDAKIAWGGGGMYVMVVEALDLVVAITGHDREDVIWNHVSKRILLAFVK